MGCEKKLKAIVKAYARRYRRRRMSDDLSYYARVQQSVLAFITNHPGTTLTAIIKELSIDPHDITNAILQLEEKGLIESHEERIDDFNTLSAYKSTRLLK